MALVLENGVWTLAPSPRADDGAWPDYPNMKKVSIDDQADSFSNPPTGPISDAAMTWTGTYGSTTAVASSGVITVTHDATNNTQLTGPRLTDELPYIPGRRRAVAAFQKATNLGANYEQVGLVFETAQGVDTSVFRFVFNAKLGFQHTAQTGGDFYDVGLLAGDITSGIWQIMWEESAGTATLSHTGVAYCLGLDANTLPSADQWIIPDPSSPKAAYKQHATRTCMEPFRAGVYSATVNTSADLTANHESIWIGYI